MDDWPALDATGYRLVVALLSLAAGVHAWTKLSPYFAATWFGSAAVFGYLFGEGDALPETVLLPGLVVYMAAAVTKGLVETRDGVRGNHLVHVLMTGLFSGVLVLPFVVAARASGWALPRDATSAPWDLDDGWLEALRPDAGLRWCLVGLAFYGSYKLLDHCGLPRGPQTVAVFGVPPLLVWAVDEAWTGLV
jgi:hypothetical protein